MQNHSPASLGLAPRASFEYVCSDNCPSYHTCRQYCGRWHGVILAEESLRKCQTLRNSDCWSQFLFFSRFSQSGLESKRCVSQLRASPNILLSREGTNTSYNLKCHRGHSPVSAPGADGNDSRNIPVLKLPPLKAEIVLGPLTGRYPKSSSRVKRLILKCDLES